MHESADVTRFPKPYNLECTPYKQTDFDYLMKGKIEKCADCNVNKVFKLIIVGDVSVGKTCIVNRFCHQLFDNNYKATIGVDFEVQLLSLFGVSVTLQIWDTAGQEKFKCIAQSYYRGAHAIIVVFDFSCISTLFHCELWLKEALNTNTNDDVLLFLVGNKADLLSPAAYTNTNEIGMKSAQDLSAEYWAVSAKSGLNVNELFLRVAALLLDVNLNNETDSIKDRIHIGSNLTLAKKKKRKSKKIISSCACNA
ncbi:hypothetical protein PPYR_11605 [Photinus pyralis]|uniref:Ras-related protein Rab-36 n=3 Tax=Photinus pyralis TaxID=7054 RepID=A0A5N4ABR3_PHOPY|nr:hypothetical protein PPYR_11605 [Photinus pyralis]